MNGTLAQNMLDWPAVKDQITITNMEALPRGVGAPYLIVVESHYPDIYIAKRWARTLPRGLGRSERIIRF